MSSNKKTHPSARTLNDNKPKKKHIPTHKSPAAAAAAVAIKQSVGIVVGIYIRIHIASL